MTMVEAFAALAEDQGRNVWARPVAWKRLRAAFCLKSTGGTVYLVPSPRGGQRAVMPMLGEILGDWELVEPHDVNEGR